MYTMIFANSEQHGPEIRELFLEYLTWINRKLIETYAMGINDVAGYVEDELQHLDKFMPPKGRLLLCYVDDKPAGMACLKHLAPGIGEIKRMYVRSEYRRQGIGRAFMSRLVEEAVQIGYQCLRLDSAPFLPESHQLYRTAGFRDIESYDGTEVPKEFHTNWVFMEKDLPPKVA